jgi:hypothetical protein
MNEPKELPRKSINPFLHPLGASTGTDSLSLFFNRVYAETLLVLESISIEFALGKKSLSFFLKVFMSESVTNSFRCA